MTADATPSYLFVDEDPLQLSALRRLSRDMPGTKRSATSAEEALRLADEAPPSVVIAGLLRCVPTAVLLDTPSAPPATVPAAWRPAAGGCAA